MMLNRYLITAPYFYFHSLCFHSKEQALFLPTTCLNIYPCKLFPCSSKSFFSLLCRRKKMCTFVSVNTSVAMGAGAGAMIICLQLPHLLGAQLPYLVTLIEGRMNTMHIIQTKCFLTGKCKTRGSWSVAWSSLCHVFSLRSMLHKEQLINRDECKRENNYEEMCL